MESLANRLAAGERVLIDGATGTDIERRGVPMTEGAWCGTSTFTHPDDVREVHLAHINAGAEMIIANTYASSRHVLAQAGIEERFEAVNRSSVELALEARKQSGRINVVVAGSMSTTRQGGPFPPLDVARTNYLDQARILADAGAELIILEMMRDVAHTEACLAGAQATGLPIWIGISAEVTDGVPTMWDGDISVDTFLQRFAHEDVDVMAIMHTETDDVDACLDVLDRHWTGPVAVYAQSGLFDPPDWVFIDVITPEDYAAACVRWLERGVQIIGGCCGIGHEHIAHLRPIIAASNT